MVHSTYYYSVLTKVQEGVVMQNESVAFTVSDAVHKTRRV